MVKRNNHSAKWKKFPSKRSPKEIPPSLSRHPETTTIGIKPSPRNWAGEERREERDADAKVIAHLAAWCRGGWDADDDGCRWGSPCPGGGGPSGRASWSPADGPPDCRIRPPPGRQRWSSLPRRPPRTDGTIPSGSAAGAAFPARRPDCPGRRAAATRSPARTSRPVSGGEWSRRWARRRRWSRWGAGRRARAGGRRRLCGRWGWPAAWRRSRWLRRPSVGWEPSLTRGTPSQAPPPRPSAPCSHPRPR